MIKDITQKIFKNVKSNLLEYHDQMRIPFEEFGNGHALMDEFIDWLQHSSTKGELPNPSISWEDGIKKGVKEYALQNQLDENRLFEDIKNSGLFSDVSFYNENLYVERMLSAEGNSVEHYSKDLFDKLINDYEDNVGGCWSWKKDNSIAYCGRGMISIKLKGYMFLDDIYWAELIRKTIGHYKDETEVRTKPRGRVMITEVIFSDFENTYTANAKSFDGPRIFKQTYFGNNTKFNGKFATIGLQGIGYDKDYIDREGNEYTKDEYVKNVLNLLSQGVSALKIFGDSLQFDDYGYATICLNKKYNIVNEKGYLISEQWFDKVEQHFNYGIAIIKLNGKYNLIDKNGKLVSNQWFDNISGFRRGLAIVTKDYKETIINVNDNCKPISDEWFEFVEYADTDMYIVCLNNRYNYMDRNGNLLCKNQWFNDCDPFFKNIAKVKLNKKYNFVDKDGQILFEKWFDKVEYSGGSIVAILNNKKYWIYSDGEICDYETNQPIDLQNESIQYYNKKKVIKLKEDKLRKIIKEIIREIL